MIKNVGEQVKSQFKKGLNTHKNFFYQDEGNTPACLNIVYRHDDSISKRYGTSSMNSVALETGVGGSPVAGYGMYDFGALSNLGGDDGSNVLLMHFNGVNAASGPMVDSSPSNHSFLQAMGTNATFDTSILKFGGASVVYGGSSALASGDSSDWDFGTSNFTIDTWFRWSQLPGSGGLEQSVLDVGGGVSTSTGVTLLFTGTGELDVYINGNQNAFGFNPFVINNWYHLAVVRNSTNLTVYIDGTAGATIANSSNVIGSTTGLIIGRAFGATTYYFQGWLDELRITKGLARWTANFTPPTSEFVSSLIQQRRLLCASGTGIYYSTDIGRTWALAQTSRTATINYFGFCKDYVINTNENYDVPQYWAGTMGTYFANINTASPMCKHSLSNQGFLILLNESSNKSSFYYVDQNSMFNSVFNSFKLPTDRNDELTAGIGLRNNLYISSKYKIFRLIYIGGNPDWYYTEVKGWGFVPKTIQKISLPTQGEVIVGLDWSKRLRIFTGSNDEIISDQLDDDNGFTPFYLDNINSIDLNKCWAENDRKAQVYRLFVVYAGSSTVSYCLCFNYREGSFYPEDNRPYNSGVLASDTADNLFMLGCNYNGYVGVMDSGNTEMGVPINDYYITPLYFNKSPSRVHKAQQLDLFFSTSSSGNIYLENRTNFSNVFNLVKEMTLVSAVSSIQIRHTIDIPETVNTCQFKLSSSSNTAEPWQLNLIDYSNSELGLGRG